MPAKLLAGTGLLVLAAFAIWLFGNARYGQGKADGQLAQVPAIVAGERRVAAAERASRDQVIAAEQRSADRLAAIEPVILHSVDTVTRYAETPAGRALCLAPDRVSGIEADRAALFAADPAAGARAAAP